MAALKNLRIGTRLGAAFGLITLLMVGLALLAGRSLSGVRGDMDSVVHDLYVKVKLVASIGNDVNLQARIVRNLVIMESPAQREQEVQALMASRERLAKSYRDLEARLHTAQGHALFKHLQDERLTYLAAQNDFLKQVEAGDIAAARHALLETLRPHFTAQTTQGEIRFHDWIGDQWAILFSHPKDFTPVCTTELGYMAKIEPEFTRRGAKLIGLSVDPVDNHHRWAKDIEETQGYLPRYPMIGDHDLHVAKLYNMLPADVDGTSEGRTAATNATVRSVFIVGPDKRIKLILTYPMTTGRNFDEILRVLDSLQLTARHKVATPANWQPGEDVIIAGSVSDEDAKTLFPQGWKAPKPYLRITKQPG